MLKLIGQYLLGTVFVILLLIGIALTHQRQLPIQAVEIPPTATPTHIDMVNEPELWSLVQNWRTSEGLQPYIKDQRLCNFADLRIQRVESNYGGFKPGNHYLFQSDLDNYFGNFPTKISVSENVNDGYTSQITLDTWLESPSHHAALEASYKYSCIATSHQYAVQEFSNF